MSALSVRAILNIMLIARRSNTLCLNVKLSDHSHSIFPLVCEISHKRVERVGAHGNGLGKLGDDAYDDPEESKTWTSEGEFYSQTLFPGYNRFGQF